MLRPKACLRDFGLTWSKFQKMIIKRLESAQSLSCIGRHTHSQMGHCDDPQLVNHHIGSLTWYPGMAQQILKLPLKLNMPCPSLMCEVYPGQCATNPLDLLNFVQFREKDREEEEGEEAERQRAEKGKGIVPVFWKQPRCVLFLQLNLDASKIYPILQTATLCGFHLVTLG